MPAHTHTHTHTLGGPSLQCGSAGSPEASVLWCRRNSLYDYMINGFRRDGPNSTKNPWGAGGRLTHTTWQSIGLSGANTHIHARAHTHTSHHSLTVCVRVCVCVCVCHPLTHSLTHSPTHSLTHSLTYCVCACACAARRQGLHCQGCLHTRAPLCKRERIHRQYLRLQRNVGAGASRKRRLAS